MGTGHSSSTRRRVTMRLPEYISKAEVKRVCHQRGLGDWTALTKATVTRQDASIILKEVNAQKMRIPIETFRRGLEVELEHGTRYKDANVTNNHPILTGMIVLAHLKETIDYYDRLEIAELEGDLLKAIVSKDLAKVEDKYRKLVEAQGILSGVITKRLK
jgi:hypothetical protein